MERLVILNGVGLNGVNAIESSAKMEGLGAETTIGAQR